MWTYIMRIEVHPLKFYPGLINVLIAPWINVSKANINER